MTEPRVKEFHNTSYCVTTLHRHGTAWSGLGLCYPTLDEAEQALAEALIAYPDGRHTLDKHTRQDVIEVLREIRPG